MSTSHDLVPVLDRGRIPIAQMRSVFRVGEVEKRLGKLPPKAAELIRRRYHLGQLPEDIAPAVGWTANSVRVALSRARQSLRECVDRSLGTPEIS